MYCNYFEMCWLNLQIILILKSEHEYLYQEGLIESIGKLSFHSLFSIIFMYIFHMIWNEQLYRQDGSNCWLLLQYYLIMRWIILCFSKILIYLKEGSVQRIMLFWEIVKWSLCMCALSDRYFKVLQDYTGEHDTSNTLCYYRRNKIQTFWFCQKRCHLNDVILSQNCQQKCWYCR